MRTTVKKLFWVWQVDKEEAWLNEMAAKGMALVSVGFCRYEFEDCNPGEYSVRLELLENHPQHMASRRYLEFLEDTGAEYVGSFLRWVYLRKKRSIGSFELHSDLDSRISHLTRILHLIAIVCVCNAFVGGWNLFLGLSEIGLPINLLGFLNILIAGLGAWGYVKLFRKRKTLQQDRQIFE